MLLLLLMAMGWAVTRQEVAFKTALITLWSLYTLVHLMLYVWKKVKVLFKVSWLRYTIPPLGTYSVTRLLEYFSILAFENLPNKVKKLPYTKKQHLKFYQSGEILANLVSLIG